MCPRAIMDAGCESQRFLSSCVGQLGVHDYKKEIQFFFFVSDPLFLTSPTAMLKKSKPREGSSISGF